MATKGQSIFNVASGETITFLQTKSDTNGTLLQLEIAVEADQSGAPPHIHTKQSEIFTVLEGSFHAVVEGRERIIRTGETITIPAGVVHQYDTKHGEAVKMIVELKPALDSESFFEGLSEASNDNNSMILKLAVLRREFDLGFYLANIPFGLQDVLFGLLARLGKLLGY